MKLIKITSAPAKNFSEFFDIRHYKIQSSSQLIVKKYFDSSKKINVNQ